MPRKKLWLKLIKSIAACGATIAAFNAPALAQNNRTIPGFVDINVYPILTDTYSDNFLTVNLAATFNDRLSYFSLNNIGTRKGVGGASDETTFYTEQSFRWKIDKNLPLDLTAQFNFRSGANNDRHRVGIRWRVSDTKALKNAFKALNLFYSVNLHGVQFDHEDPYVWQLEHAFRMTFPSISDRLYLAGFADHTFNQNLSAGFPKRPVVGEAQLGYRLAGSLFAISEYRINEYRRSDVDNLAFGLQYKISW
jgi:hypothetical protein